MTEFELIARLTEGAPREAADLPRGVGDDCAVIAGPHGRDWLVTTDAFAEGIHFEREWSDFPSLGRKALAVNVSDVAAMGGLPRFYLVTIGLAPGDEEAAAEGIYSGMRDAAHENGLVLVGGDTFLSPSGIAMSLTVIGEAGHGEAILRSGAKAGDAVFVTGSFGGAAVGLACLRRGKRGGAREKFVERHLDPRPRVAEGRAVARSKLATAMIDSSDGLLADLGHIAEASNLGFEIEAGLVPFDQDLPSVAGELGLDFNEALLSGGEDYELIFTVAGRNVSAFERTAKETGAVRIGTMVEEKDRREVRGSGGEPVAVASRGFDHFGGKGGK